MRSPILTPPKKHSRIVPSCPVSTHHIGRVNVPFFPTEPCGTGGVVAGDKDKKKKKKGKGEPVSGTLPRAIYLLTREQLFRNPRGHHQRAAQQQQASARVIPHSL